MGSFQRKGVSSEFGRQRASMVATQLEARGIADERVLAAMAKIPREEFLPPESRDEAYRDGPVPIGFRQTISQPYTVAMMSEALKLRGNEKVLEIGTGSGYAAAVLGLLAREVHTVERVPELASFATENLRRLEINNVRIHVGDGSLGLPEESPFDAIVVTAGGPLLPPAFSEQLRDGGRIVMPIGPMHDQRMCRFTREQEILREEDLGAYSFVPLIGADAWSDDSADG